MSFYFEDLHCMQVDSDSDHESVASIISEKDAPLVSGGTTLDIESYASQYEGYIRYYRLAFIARYCPQLADEALTAAIAYIRQNNCKDYSNYLLLCNWLYNLRKGEDIRNFRCMPYSILINGCNVHSSFTDSRLTVVDQNVTGVSLDEFDKEMRSLAQPMPNNPSMGDNDSSRLDSVPVRNVPNLNGNAMATSITNKELYLIPFDRDWVVACQNEYYSRVQATEEDIKKHTNGRRRENLTTSCLEMITISVNSGDISRALKHATMVLEKSSHSSSSNESKIVLKALYLALLCRGWSALERFLNRFANSPDIVGFCSRYCSQTGHTISGINIGNISQGVSDIRDTDFQAERDATDAQAFMRANIEKTKILMRFLAAYGMLQMANRKYDLAARAFFDIRIDFFDYAEVFSAANIAQYATMCSLYAYSRTELKELIFNCTNARQLLDMDTEMRDILLYFYEAKYGLCLKKLSEVQNNLKLDIFLAEHVDYLVENIRYKAVAEYFYPFSAVEMRKAGDEFQITMEELESILQKIILSEKIVAKIDSVNKIVYANNVDQRKLAFHKTAKFAETYKRHLRTVILSTNAALANMPVSNPKQHSDM